MKIVPAFPMRVLATIALVACTTPVFATAPVAVPPNPGTIKFAPAGTLAVAPVAVPPNPGTIKFAPANTAGSCPSRRSKPNPGTIKFGSGQHPGSRPSRRSAESDRHDQGFAPANTLAVAPVAVPPNPGTIKFAPANTLGSCPSRRSAEPRHDQVCSGQHAGSRPQSPFRRTPARSNLLRLTRWQLPQSPFRRTPARSSLLRLPGSCPSRRSAEPRHDQVCSGYPTLAVTPVARSAEPRHDQDLLRPTRWQLPQSPFRRDFRHNQVCSGQHPGGVAPVAVPRQRIPASIKFAPSSNSFAA